MAVGAENPVKKDLWNDYEASAFFHELNSRLCRKYLDLRKVGSDAIDPTLIVVMLNPGAAKSKETSVANGLTQRVELDDTLKQIVQLMDKVDRRCHFDRTEWKRQRTANVHSDRYLDAMVFGEPLGDLVNRNNGRITSIRDLGHIRNVVEMAMGNEDHVCFDFR